MAETLLQALSIGVAELTHHFRQGHGHRGLGTSWDDLHRPSARPCFVFSNQTSAAQTREVPTGSLPVRNLDS